MKITKWTFLGLTALFAVFSSCQKNNTETSNNNYFTYKGKNYSTGGAYYIDGFLGGGYVEVLLATERMEDSGTNLIQFGFFNSEIPSGGTFTAHYFDTPDFDRTKNFDHATVNINFSRQTLTYETSFIGTENPNTTDSTKYKMDGSTITVSKNGDNYTFVYEFKFFKNGDTSVVKGQYTGKVTK